jgi:hypothetical protein
VPHAGQVDVDEVLPGLLGDLVRLGTEREDARVRDHRVEPAELGDPVVDGGGQRLDVADVGLLGDDPSAQLLHLAHGLGQVFRGRALVEVGGHAVDGCGDVHRDDVGALLGEPDGVRPSLAASGPGDERDLAFDASCHGGPLLLVPEGTAQSGSGPSLSQRVIRRWRPTYGSLPGSRGSGTLHLRKGSTGWFYFPN